MKTPTAIAGFVVCASTSILSVLAFLSTTTSVLAQDFPKPTFNSNGELLRPDISYREWVYVGTAISTNSLESGFITCPLVAPFAARNTG